LSRCHCVFVFVYFVFRKRFVYFPSLLFRI